MSERWLEFTIRITLKHNLGSFGIQHDRLGEFKFCAQSREDAIAIAGPFTPGAMRPISTEKLVEVVEYVPVPWAVVELARCKSGTQHKDMSLAELKSWIEEVEAEVMA